MVTENYIYAYKSTDGMPVGFFLPSIHDDIPAPNIEITEEQHTWCMDHNGRFRLDIDTMDFVEIELPAPEDTAEEKAEKFDALSALLVSKGVLTQAEIDSL
jgi:hypothetical protein